MKPIIDRVTGQEIPLAVAYEAELARTRVLRDCVHVLQAELRRENQGK
jgi:hypothetical protein